MALHNNNLLCILVRCRYYAGQPDSEISSGEIYSTSRYGADYSIWHVEEILSYLCSVRLFYYYYYYLHVIVHHSSSAKNLLTWTGTHIQSTASAYRSMKKEEKQPVSARRYHWIPWSPSVKREIKKIFSGTSNECFGLRRWLPWSQESDPYKIPVMSTFQHDFSTPRGRSKRQFRLWWSLFTVHV